VNAEGKGRNPLASGAMPGTCSQDADLHGRDVEIGLTPVRAATYHFLAAK
jgi:hypothetical protein